MKKYILYVSIFFVGMIVPSTFGIYQFYKEKGKQIIGPRIFGDIAIVPQELYTGQKILNLKKNDITFMVIIQDSNGITTDVSTVGRPDESGVGEPDSSGFMMQPIPKTENWWCSYGRDLTKSDKDNGEYLIDLNFDGQFDTKFIFGNEGAINKFIFVDNDWKKVSKVNTKYAKDNLVTFYFDSNTGWCTANSN